MIDKQFTNKAKEIISSTRQVMVSNYNKLGEIQAKMSEVNDLLIAKGFDEGERKLFIDALSAMQKYRDALDNIIYDLS